MSFFCISSDENIEPTIMDSYLNKVNESPRQLARGFVVLGCSYFT